MNRATERTLEGANRDLVLASEMPDMADDGQANGEAPSPVVLRTLWQERVRLGKATLAGLVVAFVVALLIPNSYEAEVQLMPPDSSSLSGGAAILGLLMGQSSTGIGSGTSGGGLAGTVSDLLGAQKPGPIFIGILQSRTVADRLIDRFDLRKVYWRKTYDATRRRLDSHTNISEEKKSGIIKIEVSDHDRTRATAMAQAYVEELNRLLSQVNNSSASKERAFLEQRLTVVHQELQDAAKELSEFSSRNTTFDPEEQGKAMVEAAASLQGQLIAAQSELSGLEQIYTDDNVRVRTLKANVAELQDQLNQFGGKNYTGSTALDPNSLYPSLKQLPILGRRYMELYQRAQIDEKVFELLTEAYELARVQEAKETPSVKVLDAALVPEKKSWPPIGWLTFGGGLMGFALASGWVIAIKRWSELDPNEPYKVFLFQEVWPVVQHRAASAHYAWQRMVLRIRGRSTDIDGNI